MVPDASQGHLCESKTLWGLLAWMMSWDGDWEQQVPLCRRGLTAVRLAEGTYKDVLEMALVSWPSARGCTRSGAQKMVSIVAW